MKPRTIAAVLGIIAYGLILPAFVLLKPTTTVVQPGLTFDQAVAAGHGEILHDGETTVFRWKRHPHLQDLRILELEEELSQMGSKLESKERALQHLQSLYDEQKVHFDSMEGAFAATQGRVKKLEEELSRAAEAEVELIELTETKLEPEAPDEIEKEEAKAPKKKRFRWPWQKKDD